MISAELDIQSIDPLLDILFPDLPDDIQTLINADPSCAAEFLPTLRTSHLSYITDPQTESNLQQEDTEVTAKLQTTVHSYYPKLISGSSALAQFHVQFSTFSQLVNDFYTQEFEYLDHHLTISSNTQSANESDSDSILILKNLDKLQDVLELPTLTQACINNGYYTEALDLYNQLTRLKTPLITPSLPSLLEKLHLRLLRLLREPLKLPTLLKVISHLRRLNLKNLAQLYLVSRHHHIRSLLAEHEDSLLQYIEVFREHVFITVVGFRSVFPDAGDQLVSSFLKAMVKQLTERVALEEEKNGVNENADWRVQLGYCAISLGRIGAEFLPQVVIQQQRELSGPSEVIA